MATENSASPYSCALSISLIVESSSSRASRRLKRMYFVFITLRPVTLPNAGLQLQRAISIQAEGKNLLEKDAIATSAARLCSTACSLPNTDCRNDLQISSDLRELQMKYRN